MTDLEKECEKSGKFTSGERFTVLTGWAARITTVFAQLIAIRLWTDQLGVDGYAVILVLLSLQSWMLVLDLGVGTILQNRIAENIQQGKGSGPLIFTALRMVAASASVGCLAWILLSWPLSLVILASFNSLAGESWGWGVLASGGILFGIMPFVQLINRIWFAERQGWRALSVPALAQVLGCVGVMLVPPMPLGPGVCANIVAWVAPQIALPALFLFLRWKRLPVAAIDPLLRQEIRTKAGGFAVFSLLAVMVLQVDIPLLAYLTSPQSVVEYGLVQRMVSAVMAFFSAVILSAMPFLTADLARGDVAGVRKRLGKMIAGGVLMVLGGTAIIGFCRKEATDLLAPGSGIVPSLVLIWLVGLYWLLRVWTDVWAAFLQSASTARAMVIGVPCQAIITWIAMVILVPTYGAEGAAIALIIGFVSTVAWWLPWSARHLFIAKFVARSGDMHPPAA